MEVMMSTVAETISSDMNPNDTIIQLQQFLYETKNRLHMETIEKERLTEELNAVNDLASALEEKWVKSKNDWSTLEKQMRELLKKHIHLQQTSDAEICRLNEQIELTKSTNITENITKTKDINVIYIESDNTSVEETKSDAIPSQTGLALNTNLDSNELDAESKDAYNLLLSSSRANIARLRNSFSELTATNRSTPKASGHTPGNSMGDLRAMANMARLDDEVKTMRDNYEKLYKLSQAEIHALRTCSLNASDMYITDLSSKDLRAEETKHIYETDIAVMKAKYAATLNSKRALERKLSEYNLDHEREQKSSAIEFKKLQKEIKNVKERCDRESRRVQSKLEAELNLLSMEVHQLKSENMELVEKHLTELKVRDRTADEMKSIYETELTVTTQQLTEVNGQLRESFEELQLKYDEQVNVNRTLSEQRDLELEAHHRRGSVSSYPLFQEAPDEYIVPQGDCYGTSPQIDNFCEFGMIEDNDISDKSDEHQNMSMAASLDLETIYLNQRHKNISRELSLTVNSTSNEYINPLPSASRGVSYSNYEISKCSTAKNVVGFNQSETDSIETQINTDSNKYTISITTNAKDSENKEGSLLQSFSTDNGEHAADPCSVDSNIDLSANGAGLPQSRRQSRSFKQSQLYAKTLLKSRAMSSSNFGPKARESKDGESKDYDLYRFCSDDQNAGGNDEHLKRGKRDGSHAHRRSNSNPISPITPPVVPIISLYRSNSMRDLSGSAANTNIEMGFDEAMQLYADPEQTAEIETKPAHLPLRSKNSSREKPKFSDENPLYVKSLMLSRSRSASGSQCFKAPETHSQCSSVMEENKQPIVKQHSDAVSSITGPADSHSNSLDSSVAQPSAITTSQIVSARGISSPPPQHKNFTSTMSRSAQNLSRVLGLSAMKVFEGEIVRKKFGRDFMFKSSFVWINATTNSIHWAKSEEKANRHQSKYLIFPKNEFSAEALKPSGELKGYVNAAILGKTLVITTMTGDTLELQVPAKSVNDWEKVLKVMA